MSVTNTKVEWATANRDYLVAEFARLRHRIDPNGDSAEATRAIREIADSRAALESPSAIDRLEEVFGLSRFERDLLLLCAGVEMDSKLASLCAEAHGHPQRAYVTFGLAMANLAEPHWSALTPAWPLRRFRMVEVEPGHSLLSAPVRIDERILHYLAGMNLLDARLESLLRFSPFPDWIAEEHQQIAEQVLRAIESCSQHALLVHLCGDDAQGQEDIASMAAQTAHRKPFVLRAEDIPSSGPDLDQFALLWQRETLLLPAALLLQCGSSGLSQSATHFLERIPGVVFLASRDPIRLNQPFVRFDVNKPGPGGQRQLWQRALGAAAENFNGHLDNVSEQFRLSAKIIYSTGSLVSSEGDSARADELWKMCRSLARPKLEDMANRIVPCASWDDLVLPDLQMQILHQLSAQVRHRMRVYETWGFSGKGRRGLGVSALFAGDTGTGKTLAAEVLACDLGLDLYRIDLSAVVSKYIGETEKNLKQVFDAAEEGGVLLLFDEADALFGKRGEVNDSHDRYANIEVGYLLQRMETYQGLAILTTNLKGSLDRAFQRRLRFSINFSFPDAKQRQAIWSRVFPETTPTRGLDLKKLAQLNVAGGNIRNIALNAAFLAAESGGPVQMMHVLQAARLEAQKIERPLSEAEIRGWV